jgi:signal transduction histidine kinase
MLLPQHRTTALLAALLDETREPIFALDENGVIVHVTEAGSEALERERTSLLGEPFITVLDAKSRPSFGDALAHAGTQRAELEVELSGVGAASLTLRPLSQLTPRHVVVSLGGSTPSTQRAEIARALERFFLRFPFGVVGLDSDKRVAFANPRARQLLGTIRAGRIFVAPSPFDKVVERVLALPTAFQSIRVDLDDGRVIRATGIGASGSQPAVLMLEDVTRGHRETDAMYTFIRNAAHQLRTPLTSIATAVEVLQAGAKDDPVERDRFLRHIDEHAHRLVAIARGLLVLARAQSGEPPRLDFVRLEPLLTELAHETVPAPSVTIVVDCPPDLQALIEPDLMREALAAIVENAVHHTSTGTIEIAAAATDGQVAISVSDEGGGVLPEHRERLFEPFYQPIPTAGRFGLGLAIAAQAVHAMDGALTVDEAAAGARFTITLPSATKPV